MVIPMEITNEKPSSFSQIPRTYVIPIFQVFLLCVIAHIFNWFHWTIVFKVFLIFSSQWYLYEETHLFEMNFVPFNIEYITSVKARVFMPFEWHDGSDLIKSSSSNVWITQIGVKSSQSVRVKIDICIHSVYYTRTPYQGARAYPSVFFSKHFT